MELRRRTSAEVEMDTSLNFNQIKRRQVRPRRLALQKNQEAEGVERETKKTPPMGIGVTGQDSIYSGLGKPGVVWNSLHLI